MLKRNVRYASFFITKGINIPGRLIKILPSFLQPMIMVSTSHNGIYAIAANHIFKSAYSFSNFCDFSINQVLKADMALFDSNVGYGLIVCDLY